MQVGYVGCVGAKDPVRVTAWSQADAAARRLTNTMYY